MCYDIKLLIGHGGGKCRAPTDYNLSCICLVKRCHVHERKACVHQEKKSPGLLQRNTRRSLGALHLPARGVQRGNGASGRSDEPPERFHKAVKGRRLNDAEK